MGRAKTVGRGLRGAFALALASLLSGCLTTDTVPGPAIEAPPKYRAAAVKPHAALPSPDWWRGFRSRELTALVERAHLANLDIAAAVARIEQADAQTRIAGAPLLPVIGFDGSAQRSRAGGAESNRFSAVLNASYEIDFWGKNRAALRSAEFAAVASRFDREVIVLSTVSTVINTYFQILAAQDRLRIARGNVDAATRILKVFQDRIGVGTASGLDIAQQESLVAQQRADAQLKEILKSRHRGNAGADRLQRPAEVGMGENADHTGHRRCGAYVDISDTSMRQRASEQRGVKHAVNLNVIHVTSKTGQQPYVFAPRNWLADIRGHDRSAACRDASSAFPPRVDKVIAPQRGGGTVAKRFPPCPANLYVYIQSGVRRVRFAMCGESLPMHYAPEPA